MEQQGFSCQFEQYRIHSDDSEEDNSAINKAKHRITKAPVALKIILKDVQFTLKEDLHKSIPEIALENRLTENSVSCSSLMRLREHFQDDKFIYLVYPWLSQKDLSSLLSEYRIPFLSENELRSPLKQVAEAVKAMHSVGYLHNDITPRSILLKRKKDRQRFKVKLSGFSMVLPFELAEEKTQF